MTGTEIRNSALKLLGYTDNDGNAQLSQRIKNKSVSILNVVYADIWNILYPDKDFIPITESTDNINLPDKVMLNVFLFGLCTGIAQSEEDDNAQQTYSIVYNQKRSSLSRIERGALIPRSWDL